MIHIYIATMPNHPWASTDSITEADSIVAKQQESWPNAKFHLKDNWGNVLKEYKQRNATRTFDPPKVYVYFRGKRVKALSIKEANELLGLDLKV